MAASREEGWPTEAVSMAQGITVIGLGPGGPEHLTREAWEVLSQASEVWLRTGRHPAVAGLPAHLAVHTFDDLYEQGDNFESVYAAIVERLIALAARPEGVCYGVPGDPTVGEATVSRLRRDSPLPLRLVHGVSFVEPTLACLGLDALDGLSVADALDLAERHHPAFPPDAPALIGQLYSALVASDVKLTLMNQYPSDHPVTLVHSAGTAHATLEGLPLHDLDRSGSIGTATTLYVPPLGAPSAFESFQETVAHLRAPEGCPWDREQTPQSLRPHLLEEAFEALQALDADDMPALREELGDLLLQIVLQAQIATEAEEFTMADVVAGINAKIVRRHPHVFGEVEVSGVDQVLTNWEALKAAERAENDETGGLLGGVPLGLPALAQAAEIQGRVARVGFDWPAIEGVREKVQEEMQEVLGSRSPEEQTAEMGDLLFAVVNYARWLKIDPEAALREANGRFRRRFAEMEESARREGRDLSTLGAKELDRLWEAAKGGGV
jgi:tetrapyrrole methylase family protein/MazG family protein